MTHPTYSQSNLSSMSVAQLKTIAAQIGALPEGDKRSKQTWVNAIVSHQTQFSPVTIAKMEAHTAAIHDRLNEIASSDETKTQSEAEFKADLTEWQELVADSSSQEEPIVSPWEEESETPIAQRKPSIVALVGVLLFGLVVLIASVGVKAICWTFAAVAKSASNLRIPSKDAVSIDYFPEFA